MNDHVRLPQHQAKPPLGCEAGVGIFPVPIVRSYASCSSPRCHSLSMVTAVAQRGLSGRISRVIPFAGVLVGWKHRNRVYRSAEDFIRDRNRYYDALRDTARQQLVQRQQLGLRTSQVAAYAGSSP